LWKKLPKEQRDKEPFDWSTHVLTPMTESQEVWHTLWSENKAKGSDVYTEEEWMGMYDAAQHTLAVAGGFLRRFWGNKVFRGHVLRSWLSWEYSCRTARDRMLHILTNWHRTGRTSEPRTRALAQRPWLFWPQRFTLGLLPASLHCALAEPRLVTARIAKAVRFTWQFWREREFRETWLLQIVEQGRADGMLADAEYDEIRANVRNPFVVKYLECVAVHFATLPVTQIVSVVLGGIVVCWMLAGGQSGLEASAAFASILVFFQIIPISPGSLCRGGFVLFLMIRERNLRDYLVAAPLSFVKYLGYLAFPLQMTAAFPALSRFMASRWATGAVRMVPVFGEPGALLEHCVFDLCFNVPLMLGRWARPRIHWILDAWMLTGMTLWTCAYAWLAPRFWPIGSPGITITIATVCVFVLPRVLVFPLLAKPKQPTIAQPPTEKNTPVPGSSLSGNTTPDV